MRIELRGVAVGEPTAPALPPLDAELTGDAATVVTVGTERGPMLASLIAGGRLVPDRGEVLIDGRADADALRRAVALVDTPVVAEPVPDVTVSALIAEELLFASRRTGRAAVRAVVTELGLNAWADGPVSTLPPTLRIRTLLTLAARRPGVRALVLTSPERHGGPTAEWLDLAQEFTERGTPVLVIAGHAVDAALPKPRSAPRTTKARDEALSLSDSSAAELRAQTLPPSVLADAAVEGPSL